MRAIDADALMERLNRKKAGPANQRHTEGFNDCLMRVRSMVHSAPTLTPQNKPLMLEEVAEILAEQFGDECACNVNGNDEWLPMMCHYGDVCPDPPEHLGCWMELLRNKYRRPPERQEDT